MTMTTMMSLNDENDGRLCTPLVIVSISVSIWDKSFHVQIVRLFCILCICVGSAVASNASHASHAYLVRRRSLFASLWILFEFEATFNPIIIFMYEREIIENWFMEGRVDLTFS